MAEFIHPMAYEYAVILWDNEAHRLPLDILLSSVDKVLH